MSQAYKADGMMPSTKRIADEGWLCQLSMPMFASLAKQHINVCKNNGLPD